MSDNIKKYLFDIKQAIEEIEGFIDGKTYEDFTQGTLIQSAVERKLEIIGEALNRIKKLDQEVTESISDSHKIIGFRNVIIHGYDIVDSKIIWDALSYNLPKLKKDVIHLISL